MRNKYYDVATVREALTGYVPSIGAPFLQSGEIDYKSLKTYVDFLIESGAKALLLTLGDSLLTILTDEEILEMTKAVVDAANHRAMVIGCTERWILPQTLEFTQTCSDLGCDVMIACPPEWTGHCDKDMMKQYYQEVGKIMPTMLLSCSNGGVPVSIYDELTPDDGVVAVKDDKAAPYGVDALSHIRDKFAFISGGTMKFFLTHAPYGADGYLSVFARCFPQVDKLFWRAYSQGNWFEAAKVVEKYEMPFFQWCKDNGAHFDAGIRGMIEAAGLTTRYARFPYSHLNDKQMDSLRRFLAEKELI